MPNIIYLKMKNSRKNIINPWISTINVRNVITIFEHLRRVLIFEYISSYLYLLSVFEVRQAKMKPTPHTYEITKMVSRRIELQN